MSSCVRLGYDVSPAPQITDASIALVDAGQPAPARDAAVVRDAAAADSGSREMDAGRADGGTSYSNGGAGGAGRAAAAGSGGVSGSGGMGGAEQVAGAPSAGSDAGVLVDAGPSEVDLSGYYSGPWDELVLRKIDGEIWGTYTTNSGTLIGNITGPGVLQGWLSEMPSRNFNAGEVELRWSPTNQTVTSLKGRWRWGTDGDWVDGWDFERVYDRQAPSELIDRFDSPSEFRRHP
jgi:hypothetical protein